MTTDEIASWECRVMAGHDLTDFADVVQVLRILRRTAMSTLEPPLPAAKAFFWFENLSEFDAMIDMLGVWSTLSVTADAAELADTLARLYLVLSDALTADPRRPSDDEIVWRYVCGQIAETTACQVAGWSSTQLVEECLWRGLPSSSDGDLSP